MSFYPQPYKYQCGPFALKYALVMLGQFKNEREIGKRAGSNWWHGTDEIGLAKAARSYECSLKYIQESSPDAAIEALSEQLIKGYPCILSVDNWGHWLTVMNMHQNKFIIVDSGLEKVVKVYSRRQLLKRWIYKDVETDKISFDCYALIPNNKVKTKAFFSVEKARRIMRAKNKILAEKWDTYFNDLITICRPQSPNSKKVISFGEFLSRYERTIVTEVANWHGAPSFRELTKILRNLKFVAEVYDLVIYCEDEKKALISLSALLMMYSCGKYGMKPIY